MVQRAPGDPRVAAALTRVPDLPRWIDTRGMLLSGRAVVFQPAQPTAGFVAAVPDAALAAVVGTPDRAVIEEVVESLAGDVNVLAQMEDADHVASALPGWRRQRALIHVQADHPARPAHADDGEAGRGVRIFSREMAPGFDHVPDRLRRELLDALNGRTIARFVPGIVPPMPATAGARDRADGGRVGRRPAGGVLLSGLADREPLGRVDRNAARLQGPRSGHERRAHDDRAHADAWTGAGVGRPRIEHAVTPARGPTRLPRNRRHCSLQRGSFPVHA